MRHCPICENSRRELLKAHYASAMWSLYRCDCGMLYLDSETATEEGMNQFYKTIYKSDDGPVSEYRLNNLAQFIIENCKPPLLDIGGEDGKLAIKVIEIGRVNTSGAGDKLDGIYQTIVLSHTLEHVYNVDGMMKKIKAHLAPGGLVVVEVPLWQDDTDWNGYDYHYEHINKFTSSKLKELFERNGFTIEQAYPVGFYIEYNCYRLLAKL